MMSLKCYSSPHVHVYPHKPLGAPSRLQQSFWPLQSRGGQSSPAGCYYGAGWTAVGADWEAAGSRRGDEQPISARRGAGLCGADHLRTQVLISLDHNRSACYFWLLLLFIYLFLGSLSFVPSRSFRCNVCLPSLFFCLSFSPQALFFLLCYFSVSLPPSLSCCSLNDPSFY